MPRRSIVALVMLAAAAGCRLERHEEPSGAALYARHCAACHGAEGRGDGPVASALARPPPDLTTLARKNGGRFDEQRVAAVIDGRSPVVEHGTREMPVWGVVFEQELSGESYVGYRAIERSRSPTEFLETIQAK